MKTYTDFILDGSEVVASRVLGIGSRTTTLRIEGEAATLTLFVPDSDTGADWLDRLAEEAQSLAAKLRAVEPVKAVS